MIVTNTNPPQPTFGDVPNGGAFSDGLGALIKGDDGATAVRLDTGNIVTKAASDPVQAIHPNATVDLNP